MEKSKIKDFDDSKRIDREISILKKVRHPNVIQLYDVSLYNLNFPIKIIENDEFLYLIMEFCSGNELFNYIVDKKRLDEEEAARIYL